MPRRRVGSVTLVAIGVLPLALAGCEEAPPPPRSFATPDACVAEGADPVACQRAHAEAAREHLLRGPLYASRQACDLVHGQDVCQPAAGDPPPARQAAALQATEALLLGAGLAGLATAASAAWFQPPPPPFLLVRPPPATPQTAQGSSSGGGRSSFRGAYDPPSSRQPDPARSPQAQTPPPRQSPPSAQGQSARQGFGFFGSSRGRGG